MSKRKTQVTYIGRRKSGTKTLFAFLHEGKEVYFGRTRARVIGGIYSASGTHKTLSISRRPEWIGDTKASPKTVAQWEAEDLAAEQATKQRNAEYRASKNTALKQIAKALELVLEGKGYTETKAIIESLADMARGRPSRRERMKLPKINMDAIIESLKNTEPPKEETDVHKDPDG